MNDLKYVIVIPSGMNYAGRRAIIFNGWINHSDVVPKNCVAVSAGFFLLTRNEDSTVVVKTFGVSTSLKKRQDPLDSVVISKTLSRSLPTWNIFTTEKVEKPPIGVKPRWLLEEERIAELFSAASRYFEKGLDIPLEWQEEYNELLVKQNLRKISKAKG